MAKKATISELERRIVLYDRLSKTIHDEAFEPLKTIELDDSIKPNVYVESFVDGENVFMTSCANCGHHFQQQRRYYYRNDHGDKCPVCGHEASDLICVNSYCQGKKYIYVSSVEKTEEGEIIAVFYLFSELWHHTPTEEHKTANNFNSEYGRFMYCFEEDNLFLNAGFSLELKPEGSMVFSSESGIVLTELGNYSYYSIKKRNSTAYNNSIRSIFSYKKYEVLESEASAKLCSLLQEKCDLPDVTDLLTLLEEANDKIELTRKAKSSNKRKQKQEVVDVYKEYKAQEIDVMKLVGERGTKSMLMLMHNMSGITKFFKVKCSCGAEFEATSLTEHGEDIHCPSCGNLPSEEIETAYSKGKYVSFSHTYQWIENCSINNGLLFRRFNVIQGLSLQNGYTFSVREISRIFVGKDSTLIYENVGKTDESVWAKQRITYMNSYSYSTNTAQLNTDEELIAMIKNSDFKYSGLIDAWGLGVRGNDLRIESKGALNNNTYIIAWQKAPCIEIILKSGLKSITTTVMHSPYSYIPKLTATNILEILNIKKPTLAIAQELNVNVSELGYLRRINEIDPQVTTELYNKISRLGCENVLRIAENYRISFKRIFEYIESCYNNQCIENQSAFQIWMDYLKMIRDMNYTFTDKSIVYPSSLKKEHDKAVFAYRVVQNEIKTKKFKEVVEAAKKLEYHYGDYIVKLPSEANEVVKEGTDLHHCVASYVTRIQEGETLICFIRKKAAPDNSFFTVEVKNNSITQVRGLQNCPPPEDVVEFVKKWATFKNLKINYY